MSMTGKEITEMQKKYNLQSWSAQKNINPTPVEKAEGIYYWDYDGKRHTDMLIKLLMKLLRNRLISIVSLDHLLV